MLASAGVAQAQTKLTYKPTKRGGGGALKVALVAGRHAAESPLRGRHQGPGRLADLLRAPGLLGSRRQPLAHPRRRDSQPCRTAGVVAGRQVGHLEAQEGRHLARRQALHRRRRASSTGSTCADPATASANIGTYKDIKVEKVDSHTIKVTLPASRRRSGPTPSWASRGMIIPKHLFEAFKGGKSREAPANLKPVGTGPYKFVDFKPGDMVRGEINPTYHMPNRPFFDTIEMKGGGDAVSAARAVIQTGEFDYAWNMQVEDEILKRMEQGGKGKADIVAGGNIEHIQCNFTDPWKEVDGERVEPQDHASVPERPRGAAGAEPPGRPRLGAGADLRPHRHRHRELPQPALALRVQEPPSGSSTSTRPTRSSRRRAGRRARTASGPRTARSSSSSTRPRSTPRARRPRPSSSRRRPRRASRSSSSR